MLGVVPARLGEEFVQIGLRASSELGSGGNAPRVGDRHIDIHVSNPVPLAPASRQTRATACSSGRARVGRTPEVAQAAR